MNEQAQDQNAGGDFAGIMTVALAIALLIGGIAAFYLLDTRPDWQRWGSTGVGVVAAIAVFALSPMGRRFWQFILDSRVELRKVVWPSRQETIQVTIVVIVMVIVLSLFFWGLDSLLGLLTRWLTGAGD